MTDLVGTDLAGAADLVQMLPARTRWRSRGKTPNQRIPARIEDTEACIVACYLHARDLRRELCGDKQKTI
jgi:hypothetical protein